MLMKQFLRKISVLAAILSVGTALSAQNKGDMYISGSLGISGGNTTSSVTAGSQTTKIKDPSSFTFQIEPQFGYFVMDRLEVNLSIGYSLTRSEPNRNSTADKNFYDFTNLFTIAPGVSYYLPVCDRLWYTPAFQIGVGFGSYKSQLDASTTEKSGLTTFGMALSILKFEFRPCDHLGIALSAGDLSYTLTHRKYEDTINDATVKTVSNNSSVDLGLNLGTSIAFRYYF